MTNTKLQLDRSLKQGIHFLARAQADNGSFLGRASQRKDDFSRYRLHPTAFFTSLIVSCLDQVPGSKLIKDQAAKFILQERSSDWSWNYWLRDSKDAVTRTYPDDLDDTACAFSALTNSDSNHLPEEAWANFAKLLISQEQSPGGPYTTWLVNKTAEPVWRDVDVAVNANIGFALHHKDVHLLGLEQYITDRIRTDNLMSPYYYTEIPVIYFIARWYRGEALEQMRSLVKKRIETVEPHNSIHISLLISAACRIGLHNETAGLVKRLLCLQRRGFWPADTLYYEPPINGRAYFAGSPALTTAFAVEALQQYANHTNPTAPTTIIKQASNIQLGLDEFPNLNLELNNQYQEYLNRLIAKDKAGHISNIATLTAKSTGKSCALSTLRNLNLASLHGWTSYTIFDDILDQTGDPTQVSLAMLALRRTVYYFEKALPGNTDFSDYVNSTLDTVDSANAWELQNARAQIVDGLLSATALPDYRDLGQLAERSWGHSLASSGVLVGLDYTLTSPEQAQLQQYFRHYLIARQLNDDAHDWRTDLEHGHLSYVVTHLIRNYFATSMDEVVKIDLKTDMDSLTTFFWEETIVDISEIIHFHLAAADQALEKCAAIHDKTVFKSWLQDLNYATNQALSKRQESIQFIQAFSS